MEIDLVSLLSNAKTFTLFLVLGVGYLLGNIPLGQFRLGPTAGVLIAGLFFGHMGFGEDIPGEQMGFILFIYSVGLQAGPRFFSVFLHDGLRYLSLALVVALVSVMVALFLGWVAELPSGLTAGLLAGALTSTPTLAAAQDAVASGLVSAPEGMSAYALTRQISIGYALTYIFGLVGLIMFIKWMPGVLKINLAEEARALQKDRRFAVAIEEGDTPTHVVRAYEVTSENVAGKRIEELTFCKNATCVIQDVKRGGEIIPMGADTKLESGDHISISGRIDVLAPLKDLIGPEVQDTDLFDSPIESVDIIVTHQDAAGRSLADLHLLSRFSCYVTSVIRAQIRLPVSPGLVLEKGDVVRVTGMRRRLDAVTQALGQVERDIVQTDLLTFAFGIAAGLLIAEVSIKVGAVSLGLGTAGGLLFSGIMVGFLRSMNPTFGRVPPAARWILMEFGLMLFMAGVGLRAGKGVWEAILSVGPLLFVCGAITTMAPVLAGYFFGRKVLKLNPALLMGALTGAMTSTPALNIVTDRAKSPLPSLGYAGTYTFANVFLALAGTIVLML